MLTSCERTPIVVSPAISAMTIPIRSFSAAASETGWRREIRGRNPSRSSRICP